METWTMDVCEKKSQSLYVPQSAVFWIIAGTCTHLKERRYTFFSVSMTIFYHMYFQQYGKYLKGTNRKQEKLFCLSRGLNPGPFSPKSALPSEPSHLILHIYIACPHSLLLSLEYPPQNFLFIYFSMSFKFWHQIFLFLNFACNSSTRLQ